MITMVEMHQCTSQSCLVRWLQMVGFGSQNRCRCLWYPTILSMCFVWSYNNVRSVSACPPIHLSDVYLIIYLFVYLFTLLINLLNYLFIYVLIYLIFFSFIFFLLILDSFFTHLFILFYLLIFYTFILSSFC